MAAAAAAAVAALAAWKWCYSLACLQFTGAALTKVIGSMQKMVVP